jgi:predicted ATPase
MLVGVTFRPEFEPPWIGRPHTTLLSLNRLSRRQGAELAAEVAGGRGLPPEVLEQVVARADGVPLFVEELTRMVLESGMLKEQDGQYVLDGPLPPLAIPAALQDSLMARLDRLAPAKQVAQTAAAIGRSFRHDLLAAVANLEETKLVEALGQLVDAGLVFRQGVPPAAGDGLALRTTGWRGNTVCYRRWPSGWARDDALARPVVGCAAERRQNEAIYCCS